MVIALTNKQDLQRKLISIFIIKEMRIEIKAIDLYI